MARALHHQGKHGTYIVLYVGENPVGPRGGTCGIVVNAVAVASGAAAKRLLRAPCPDEMLVDAVARLGRQICARDIPAISLNDHELQWHAWILSL